MEHEAGESGQHASESRSAVSLFHGTCAQPVLVPIGSERRFISLPFHARLPACCWQRVRSARQPHPRPRWRLRLRLMREAPQQLQRRPHGRLPRLPNRLPRQSARLHSRRTESKSRLEWARESKALRSVNSNGVMSLTNLRRATPQLLTGLGFSCDTTRALWPSPSPSLAPGTTTPKTGCRPVTARSSNAVFVSAQFGSGSSQTIPGYSVGATTAVSKYLRFLAGSPETPVNEVPPGVATGRRTVSTEFRYYFRGKSGEPFVERLRRVRWNNPAAGAAAGAILYYPGAVTEARCRGGFLMGVAWRLISTIFSAETAKTDSYGVDLEALIKLSTDAGNNGGRTDSTFHPRRNSIAGPQTRAWHGPIPQRV